MFPGDDVGDLFLFQAPQYRTTAVLFNPDGSEGQK